MLQPTATAATSATPVASGSATTNSAPIQNKIQFDFPPILAAAPPPPFPNGTNALENSVVTLEKGDEKTLVCVFCPGKRLKEGKMTEVHLAGKDHIKRTNKFKAYFAAASPEYAEFDARFITQEMDQAASGKPIIPVAIVRPVDEPAEDMMEGAESGEIIEAKQSNKRARSAEGETNEEEFTEAELKLKKKKLQKTKSIELERQKKAAAQALPDDNRDAAIDRKERNAEISAAKKLVQTLKAVSKKAKTERQKLQKKTVALISASDKKDVTPARKIKPMKKENKAVSSPKKVKSTKPVTTKAPKASKKSATKAGPAAEVKAELKSAAKKIKIRKPATKKAVAPVA